MNTAPEAPVARPPHSLILCGFDRSGSSAIARSLASHPLVELFMQPFNSGPVREKMYRLWDDKVASPDDVRFFSGLERGELHRDYIRSHWFAKSTVQDFVPGRLHIVKTTLNHFVSRWSIQRFPDLAHWAIWRDPRDVLASLIRNDFIGAWYADALTEISPAVLSDPELSDHFASAMPQVKDHEQAQAAFLIAVRSYVLFRAVPVQQRLSFERFREDPSAESARLFTRYGLNPIQIDGSGDKNLTGKAFEATTSHQCQIDPAIKPLLQTLFAPLEQFRPI